MTPTEFKHKWRDNLLGERQFYQLHFADLCDMLGHPKPEPSSAATFCFEKPVNAHGGGKGFADVWKRGFFGWEYKGDFHADIIAAELQLLRYRKDLGTPPLLVVADRNLIRVIPDFTNADNHPIDILLDDIDSPEAIATLTAVFNNPQALHPRKSAEELTKEVAADIGDIARAMRERGVDEHDAAHYLMRLVFCLFAEDCGLLPAGIVGDTAEEFQQEPETFNGTIADLFAAMATGGRLGRERIEWFNGGLFEGPSTGSGQPLVVDLEPAEIYEVALLAKKDWSQIKPDIFGTLFQVSLREDIRSKRGAFYTGQEHIEKIVRPVVIEPLRREWEAVKADCDRLTGRNSAQLAARTRWANDVTSRVGKFLDRLAAVRVLDPACGSGNFLYVTLHLLQELEHEVIRELGEWGAGMPLPQVDPSVVLGLEIEPYAVELARLTVWIGYLQWRRQNGYLAKDPPILKSLDTIREQDAIIDHDAMGGAIDAPWPAAEFIVGNPPHLGCKLLRSRLGAEYTAELFSLYRDRISGMSDLCCYWFERARQAIEDGTTKRAGLVGTAKMDLPNNRKTLRRITETGGIFEVEPNDVWPFPDAAHRVCLVAFDDGTETERRISGQPVTEPINALLDVGLDLTDWTTLPANKGIAFVGDVKGGPFDIPESLAGDWLDLPNPRGRSNRDVLRPWLNGEMVSQRESGRWIIDFGLDMPQDQAELYERPFAYVEHQVKPAAVDRNDRSAAAKWWLHTRPGHSMREALYGLRRYLARVAICDQNYWVWVHPRVLCDHELIVVAREDWLWYGLLHSRPHTVWFRGQHIRKGKGDALIYSVTDCFEPFPFPDPTPEEAAAIGTASRALERARKSRLKEDRRLTLTGLYGAMPSWLQRRHKELDAAVMAAYGWDAGMGDEALGRALLGLNAERAAVQG